MAQRVDPAERLLDLVIALTHAGHRITKSQIRAQVHGYETTATPEAFERMFERDKDTLRDLGVPLVTETDPTHGDEVGYRIDTAGYQLPPIDLTPAELGVLSLAAQVWRDASLHGPAARALTKLRAVGPAADPDTTAGIALRLRAPEDAFGTILTAITERRAVTFRYRTAGTGEVRTRVVEPWRLVSQDRAWYLTGLDRDRDAPRTFRLSRVEGQVRSTGPAGATSLPAAGAQVGPTPEAPAGTARLAVLPERAAALRTRASGPPDTSGPRDVVEIPVDDAEQLADELAGYADAVLVLAPAPLREAVLRRLRAASGLAPRGGDG